MKRRDFIALWKAHFREVRERQYAGDPHGPACAAACAWDDEKAGERNWRRFRVHYRAASEAKIRELLDIDPPTTAIR